MKNINLACLCALGFSAICEANQFDRLYAVPGYSGSADFFLVADLTLTGCGWPDGILSEMQVEYDGGEIVVAIKAPRSGDFCPFTNQPFKAQAAVPIGRFLGDRPLNFDQRVSVQIINELGAVVAGSAILSAETRADVLPEAGAWSAEYGTRLWVDYDRGGLSLAFSSDDLGEVDPRYQWPEPGKAVSWKGLSHKLGFAQVSFEEIVPRIVSGSVGQSPLVRQVDAGYVAFSDPLHGFLVLPSGVVTAISKRSMGGRTISLDPALPNGTTVPDLSGEWVWVKEGSALHGLRTKLTLAEVIGGLQAWKLDVSGARGGGKVICSKVGECTVFLTTRADVPAGPVARFMAADVGDRTVFIQGMATAFRVGF